MTAPRPAVCRMLLVAAVLVVFGRLLLCDFTYWDDQHTIHHNPQLNPVQWDTFVHNWTQPSASIYIPLTFTVWALLTFIARVPPDTDGITLNPMVYHGASVLIHALAALAAFALLRRLTKNDLAAWLGAMLWALHPVQVESVGWASGLKDVLSGALVLATLLLYVKWRQGEATSRGTYALAVVVYVLAMLAKPSAFTTPLILIALDWLYFRTRGERTGTDGRAESKVTPDATARAVDPDPQTTPDPQNPRLAPPRLGEIRSLRTFYPLVPFVIVTIPIALIARLAQPAAASGQPGWVRPFVVGDNLVFYAGKILAPIHLTFDYGRPIDWLRERPTFWVAWLLPAAVAIFTLLAYRRAKKAGRPLSPLVALGLCVFVFAPLHVLGLTRFDFQVISAVADHYLYVALLGPAMLLAWAVIRWPKLAMPAALLIAVYGVRAAVLTPVWQNSRTLYTHAVEVNPNSWTGWTNLSILDAKEGRPDLEWEKLQRAQAIRPNDPMVVISLLSHHLRQNDLESARASARKLIEIYNTVWVAAGAEPVVGYMRVIDEMLGARQPDEAEQWLIEARHTCGDHPALQNYAARIAWQRQSMGLAPGAMPPIGP